jgi:hypothetical protein
MLTIVIWGITWMTGSAIAAVLVGRWMTRDRR